MKKTSKPKTQPFTVHHEDAEFKRDEAENCTDCHQPTRYWLPDKHTPLCPDCCAKRNNHHCNKRHPV